ncbi:MAG: efflux RND transporter periplasmic adaptor subunit [Bacteroidetes bacterium]|nr:efflux RND transporter periplasmic adaptor subunit [Bacteroidota bacterium]
MLFLNKKKIEAKSKLDGNLASIPVYIMEIKKATMGGDFEVNGSFLPVHELTLMSEGQGKVVELEVNTGNIVQSGQVLAELDDVLIKSQLALANASLEKARADLKKYEGLLKADAISGQQVEDIRLALIKAETDVTILKKQLDFTTIKAPIQGTITRRYVEKGSLLMPGSPVVDIVDVSHLKFMANVAESEVVQIHTGHQIQLTTTLFPGIKYAGTVVSVGVKADDARRFPVEIEMVNDAANPLKAGMFGTAVFGSGTAHEALLIPRGSIVGSIKNPKIYIVLNNRAILRDIRIGSANDHEVEVLDGLKEGDFVVTSGQINLDNNATVRVVNNK